MSLLEKITEKPWLEPGSQAAYEREFDERLPAGRIGLRILLAVITSFFTLFIITYWSRMQLPDWEMLRDPGILWLNTGMLVLASLAFARATSASRRDDMAGLKTWLVVAAALTVGFVAGQIVAWNGLVEAGYYVYRNPANAFFYLFTGLHALHMLGGLWFLLRLRFRLRDEDYEKARLQVSLCATYWHFLLLVWLVLFALLLRT